MWKILIFVLEVSRVFSLKCHICQNSFDPQCYEVEKANGKFLQDCNDEQKECAVLKERTADPFITRICVAPGWRCNDEKFKCETCSTDGCNIAIEIKPKKNTNVMPQTTQIGDLLKANSAAVCIIAGLVALAFVWGFIRCCSRKKKVVEEDDCDEYYENETHIELE